MHTRNRLRCLLLRAFVLSVLAGGTAGCGKELCTVTGRVTFKDQLVTSGSVVLYSEGRQSVRSLIRLDGTFAIPNVPRGHFRVTVVPPVRVPDGFRKKYATPPVFDGPITPEVGRSVKNAWNPAIPNRYGVPEESGLTVTVDRLAMEYDIVLGG